MSAYLEPRKVEKGSTRKWWYNTRELFARNPLRFLVIALLFFLMSLGTIRLRWFSFPLGLLLTQLFLSTTILTAEAADLHKELSLRDYYTNIRDLIVILITHCAAYFAVILILIIAISFLSFDINVTEYSASEYFALLWWLVPGMFNFELLYSVIIVTNLWFLTPLVTLNHLHISDAARLSWKADKLNTLAVFGTVIVPFIVLFLLFTSTVLSTVFTFMLFPFFGIMQYVSYRHVFLGRKDNQGAVICSSRKALVPVPIKHSRR